jgi:ribosomal protein S14
MIDFNDAKEVNYQSGKRIAYRVHCDKCGKDRGYKLKSAYRKFKLCKSCGQIKNLDNQDFIIKNNRVRIKASCSSCGKDRGYVSKKRINNVCNPCSQKGKKKKLATKIKISCSNRKIAEKDFNGFSQNKDIKERKYFNSLGIHTKCFAENDFTCQKCGVRGGDLNAHHIEPWSNNLEKRYDITNLACLCSSCHADFHKTFGYVNFSSQDFDNWIRLTDRGVFTLDSDKIL